MVIPVWSEAKVLELLWELVKRDRPDLRSLNPDLRLLEEVADLQI